MENHIIDLHHKTLLIVDDEKDLREILAGELEFMGAKVFQAENIQHAQDILSHHPVDLMISDIRMPGGSGVELMDIVKKKYGVDFPVILITGFADISPMDAFGRGAEALINKPFQLDQLFKIISKHASRPKLWNDVIETNKVVIPLDDKIVIGRGGVSFFINTRDRIDPGEGVRFDFHLEGKHIKGTGICRWVKSAGQDNSVLGLEFSSLAEESSEDLPRLKRSDAYIPASSEL